MKKNKWIPKVLNYRTATSTEEGRVFSFRTLRYSSDRSHPWFEQFYKKKKPRWKRKKWIDVPDAVNKEISQIKVLSWKEEWANPNPNCADPQKMITGRVRQGRDGNGSKNSV